MRVLFIVPDLFGSPGGIARYCSLVARVLDRTAAVDQLDVLALHDPATTPVDHHYLSSPRFTYRGFGGDRLAFGQAVLQQRWRGRYDLLLSGHVHLTPLLFVPPPHLRPARRVTFVYGTDVWSRLAWHRQRCLRASDLVIAISHFTAGRAMAANRLAPGRVRVLPNCLDPAFEPSRLRTPGPPPADNVILTVSRLSKAESGKGHHTVLRALPCVLQAAPGASFWRRWRMVGRSWPAIAMPQARSWVTRASSSIPTIPGRWPRRSSRC
jgi:glycosyltransferase involved in cell wall biosynthesis